MKKKNGGPIKALLLFCFIGSFGIFIINDYIVRIEEYNKHMCVDVYGKDENCRLIEKTPEGVSSKERQVSYEE